MARIAGFAEVRASSGDRGTDQDSERQPLTFGVSMCWQIPFRCGYELYELCG